jgi:hypothetical protein
MNKIQEIKKLKKDNRDMKKILKEHSKKYVIETRKAIATALLAAFAFLMALSWRGVVSEWVETAKNLSPLHGNLIEAGIVTVISVLGILLVSRFIAINE